MKVAEGRDVEQDVLELLKDWRGEMSEVDEENVRGIACGGQMRIALDGLVEITLLTSPSCPNTWPSFRVGSERFDVKSQ